MASNDGFGWTAISAGNLNPNGDRTSISALYDFGFSAINCEFVFRIWFSIDGSGPGKLLGEFHAPLAQTAGAIPLGLKCDGETGELCSDDPSIKEIIRRNIVKQRISAYNKFKQDYDADIRREKSELDSKERDAQKALKDKATQNWSSEDANKAYLAERVAAWQNEFDTAVRARAGDASPIGNIEPLDSFAMVACFRSSSGSLK
jgi:hypothetical protein